jgi:hypothetical protein
MAMLPEQLLSAALRVRWDDHRTGDHDAIRRLAERAPGFDAQQYTEACRRAAELNDRAYDLAAAWFASGGSPRKWPSAVELERLCPGFTSVDYDEAIEKNILWARK